MPFQLFQLPKVVPIASTAVVSGGKLQFLKAGTTTPQPIYSDAALSTQHSNPVIADSAGVFAPIYLDADLSYRVQLKTSADVLVYDVDDINDVDFRKPNFPQTQAESNETLIPSDLTYREGHVRRYGLLMDGTEEATTLQTILDFALATGVRIHGFDPDGTIRCDSAVTLQSTVTSAKNLFIDFNNVLLDFSNLTGSTVAFTVGATSLANAHDVEQVYIGPFRMLGPEANSGPFAYADRVTTTTGLYLQYCLHWTFAPFQVFAFYKGMRTFWSWNNFIGNSHIRNCYIGTHFDEISTFGEWSSVAWMQCSYAHVFSGADTIAGQVFNACRFEGNWVDVAMDADPGVVGGGTYTIRHIAYNNCYLEPPGTTYYDRFRIGMDFDETALVSTRQATNTSGSITGIRVIGGNWANNTLDAAAGTAAFCFDKDDLVNAKVVDMRFEGPISLNQRCRGRPSKSAWIETRNTFHDGDDIEQFESGEFYANITMAAGSVTLGRRGGNIASISHVADGVFDVTFHDAYSATTEFELYGETEDAHFVSHVPQTTSSTQVTVYNTSGVAEHSARISICGNGRLE